MKKFFDKLRRWLIRRLGGCPNVRRKDGFGGLTDGLFHL